MRAPLLVLAAALCAGQGVARELFVGPGEQFKTIAQAIEAAQPGDTVTIRAGVYREQIAIAKSGAKQAPLVVRADPRAPAGAVVLDGSREIPAERWQRFVSARFGVRAEHNVWCARHAPEEECAGRELLVNAWPYKLHPGGWRHGPDVRYGTFFLFKNGAPLTLVPDRPDAGKMADKFHADSEETQSHEYITATSPKFLKPNQWIWYDAGLTDGADEDTQPVAHPKELQNHIFVRLPESQTPRTVRLAVSVKSTLVEIKNAKHVRVEGLTLLRADHTAVSVLRSEDIVLRGLTIQHFGGGRKFYYSAACKQHLYGYGAGISCHTSDVRIERCVVRNGFGKGITVWGAGPSSPYRTVIRENTIANIAPHPWGGGWAHGRGTGIGTGNACNVLIAGNVVRDVANCGVWVDGGEADSGVHILANRFERAQNFGFFLELGIVDALAAFNEVVGCTRGFRVGPAARNCRVLANLFCDCELGAAIYVFPSRVGARRDTIVGLCVAGNVFCRVASRCVSLTQAALENRKLLFDYNRYHCAGEQAKAFEAGGGGVSFDRYRELLRETGHFARAEEHSVLLAASPVGELPAGRYSAWPLRPEIRAGQWVDELVSLGFLSGEERRLLGGM